MTQQAQPPKGSGGTPATTTQAKDGGASSPASGTDVATRPPLPLPSGETRSRGGGIYKDVDALSQAFAVAAEHYNLLAPVTRVDFIPPFHSISLRIVQVNPVVVRGQQGDVYPVEGGLAFHKSTLDRFAATAGISWDPLFHGRLDDGSDAHYVRFRAVGHMVDFDGRERIIARERAVDLRDGSALYLELKGGNNPDKAISQARKFIAELAESKAANRVIRTLLAIKSKYTAEELRRPFVIPTLVFDGRTEDPELRKMIAEKIADRALSASSRLFGSPAMRKPDAQATVELEPLGTGRPPAIETEPAGARDDDGAVQIPLLPEDGGGRQPGDEG